MIIRVILEQQYLPDEIKNTRLYVPQANAQEAKIWERMKNWWKKRF